jgi:hypothetical protein
MVALWFKANSAMVAGSYRRRNDYQQSERIQLGQIITVAGFSSASTE